MDNTNNERSEREVHKGFDPVTGEAIYGAPDAEPQPTLAQEIDILAENGAPRLAAMLREVAKHFAKGE